MTRDGWAGLFASAFNQSRNPMVLVDAERRITDANGAFVRLLGRARNVLLGRRLFTFVAGGPLVTPGEWRAALAEGRFTGQATLLDAGGGEVAVQFAGSTETVTGQRLVLFVVLSTSLAGAHFRRAHDSPARGTLSPREREVVQRVALGETGPEIAAELGIAHETVRTHASSAMTKLGARSRAHLVAKALTEALVEISPGASGG
jgi:PAS domain S-box-containing protein